MRLSKSAVEMYQQCPRKYQLHYKEGYRGNMIDSPLFFGSAIDEALNALLLTKKRELTEDEVSIMGMSAQQLFEEKLTNVEVMGKMIDIRCSKYARYSNADLDISLLEESDIKKIIDTHTVSEIELTMENWEEFVTDSQAKRKAKEMLDMPEYRLFNYFSWMSLYKKGLMMIGAYEKDIMPEIKEVHSIQEKVDLPNEQGDYIIGYIDFEATMMDGVRRVLDNKTSSKKYTEKNISESIQASVYAEYKQNFEWGFVVLEKNIRKREPRARAYYVLGKVTQQQVEDHFIEIDGVLTNIRENNFDKNEESCFLYYKPCQFYDICHNNDYTHVTKKEVK